MECIGSEPLYFNPSTNTLVPLDPSVLKTTSWNYSVITCDDGNAGGENVVIETASVFGIGILIFILTALFFVLILKR